jgi:hypothetical protein
MKIDSELGKGAMLTIIMPRLDMPNAASDG